MKKYHLIYKTTNINTGRFYIGMHSTNNIEDGYIGSGTWLRHSIKKHGVESFDREILHLLDTRKLAYEKEKELVTKYFIDNNKVYNLVLGGAAGKKIINKVFSKSKKLQELKVKKEMFEPTFVDYYIKCVVDSYEMKTSLLNAMEWSKQNEFKSINKLRVGIHKFLLDENGRMIYLLEKLLNNKFTFSEGKKYYNKFSKYMTIKVYKEPLFKN